MTWAEMGSRLADAAEKARQAGDTAASLALAVRAAQATQIARLLPDSHRASAPDRHKFDTSPGEASPKPLTGKD